jgi:hypothetical protein
MNEKMWYLAQDAGANSVKDARLSGAIMVLGEVFEWRPKDVRGKEVEEQEFQEEMYD